MSRKERKRIYVQFIEFSLPLPFLEEGHTVVAFSIQGREG